MSRLIDSTPRTDGFRMRGEFEPHKQIWRLRGGASGARTAAPVHNPFVHTEGGPPQCR